MSNSIPYVALNSIIIDNVLPKCNLVYGNTFSSIYLQLYLNTNYNEKSVSWKRNKCWMGINTIAKNVNCSPRTASMLLKIMEDIGLIEKTYKGKFYMFSIKHNLHDKTQLEKLNIDINQQLTKHMDIMKANKTLNKFKNIDNVFKKNEEYNYSNIVDLKKWLLLVEKIQSGSSLLFLIFFSKQLTCRNSMGLITEYTETDMSVRLGMSQSTINRYLNKFENSNLLNIEYERNKKISKISINKEWGKMNNTEIVNEKVEDVIKCPVCGKEVINIKKLNSHINRCKDELHVIFSSLQEKNDSYTYESIMETYENNKSIFENIKNKKEAEKTKFNNIAVKLVKYYYGLTNTKCPNWGKESNLIKSHLKHGLTPDEIMEVMRFMSRRSYQDLRFFNNSINDALLVKQCKEDVKIEGTDAYLVKLYFSKMGQSINDRLMIQAMKKIGELKNSGYEYEQIKTIIEYMVEKRCPSFNFIVNMANEALTNSKPKDEQVKAYTIKELVDITLGDNLQYGIVMMKDCNYDMAEKQIIMRLKQDLCAGVVDLCRVNKTYNTFAIELAKEIYSRKLFDSKLTPQQWLLKTHLNMVNIE